MLSWFHALSDFTVFLLMFLLVVLPIVAAPHILRLVTRHEHHQGMASGSWEAVKVLSGFAGAVIAFSLVQVHGNLRSAAELVIKEASTITAADRILLRIGHPEASSTRSLLHTYITSIIDDDWPSMKVTHAQGSGKTDAVFAAMTSSARLMVSDNVRQQTMLDQLQTAMDGIFDARENRLSAADWQLPDLFWWAILSLLVLLLGLVMLMECSAERTLAVLGIAAGLSLMLALLIIIDGPFDGETSVPPSAISRSLVDMRARN